MISKILIANVGHTFEKNAKRCQYACPYGPFYQNEILLRQILIKLCSEILNV